MLNFGFPSDEASTKTLPLHKMKLTTWGPETLTNGTVKLINPSSPKDQREIVTFQTENISTVTHSKALRVDNPTNIPGGIMYTVKAEEVGREQVGEVTIDHPIVATLSIRHDLGSGISGADIDKVLNRLLDAVYKEDGSSRFDDLMSFVELPRAN